MTCCKCNLLKLQKRFCMAFLRNEELDEDCWWHIKSSVNNCNCRRQVPDEMRNHPRVMNSVNEERRILSNGDAEINVKWIESNLTTAVNCIYNMPMHSMHFLKEPLKQFSLASIGQTNACFIEMHAKIVSWST